MITLFHEYNNLGKKLCSPYGQETQAPGIHTSEASVVSSAGAFCFRKGFFSRFFFSPCLLKDRTICFIIYRHGYTRYPYSRGLHAMDNVESIYLVKDISRVSPSSRVFIYLELIHKLCSRVLQVKRCIGYPDIGRLYL